MKRVSYNLKRTSLLMMIGLQMLGMTACGTGKTNKAEESTEQVVKEESNNYEDSSKKDSSSNDISQEISFNLPQDLTMDEYDSGIGLAGGCVFQPQVYKAGSEILPVEWTSSGMVSRYVQANVLTWDKTSISNVNYGDDRSIMEFLENINDLAAPAVLMHGNYHLYTAYGMELLQKNGTDFSTIDLTSDYWYLFIAKPDEEYGYVITLNQKNYTRDDIMTLGKSIQFAE